LALSSTIRQLENFAGVMNFVIFPAFFLSSALYPLWKMQESSTLLYRICAVNPFTHAVEAIRFGLYGEVNLAAIGWSVGALIIFLSIALHGYNPARAMSRRRFQGG
jgi:ABC-2 type transport system permease protein